MTELIAALYVILYLVWIGVMVHFDEGGKMPRPWDPSDWSNHW